MGSISSRIACDFGIDIALCESPNSIDADAPSPQIDEILTAVLDVLKTHGIPFDEVLEKIDSSAAKDRSACPNELVRQAIEYIDLRFQDQNLSAKTICSHLHISTVYFSKIFKQYTGTTFISYLTHVRTKKAAELLVGSSEKASSIAFIVGYGDPYYFARVFKKIYGLPPSLYKQLMPC